MISRSPVLWSKLFTVCYSATVAVNMQLIKGLSKSNEKTYKKSTAIKIVQLFVNTTQFIRISTHYSYVCYDAFTPSQKKFWSCSSLYSFIPIMTDSSSSKACSLCDSLNIWTLCCLQLVSLFCCDTWIPISTRIFCYWTGYGLTIIQQIVRHHSTTFK